MVIIVKQINKSIILITLCFVFVARAAKIYSFPRNAKNSTILLSHVMH